MEQENAEAQKKNVSLSESDHDKIVGTVFKPENHDEKEVAPQSNNDATPRKKRPRISRKVNL